MGCIIDDIGKRRHLSRVGSPNYAAPQIHHNSPYSIKCDVYSVNLMFMVELGVVAFLLLYNTFPVNGNNLGEI
jgi:serine/threonine protein kinase